MIDIDVATHPGRALVTGQVWSHIYSDKTHVYNLRLAPPTMPDGDRSGGFLSYQGLPGAGFDGMHAPPTTPTWTGSYDILPNPAFGQIAGLPIEVASTKSLYGRWWWEGNFPATSKLRETTSGQPLGEFENPLPWELHDCRLIYHRWITPDLGKLGPGQKFTIGVELTPLDLEYKLTLRRDSELKEPAARWDQNNHDIERVAEVYFFHEASGGQAHTRLTHRYQGSVDMTSLLRSGRAVLIGRSPRRSARLLDQERPIGADDDGHWTWFRVVLPVKLLDWKPRNDL